MAFGWHWVLDPENLSGDRLGITRASRTISTSQWKLSIDDGRTTVSVWPAGTIQARGCNGLHRGEGRGSGRS